MSVRVVARIRPLLKQEFDKDCIVEPVPTADGARPTVLKLPNPKNASESYSFNFNSVYDQTATQQDLFDNEVSPTVKHLFNGYDVTLFAYGVTGTGKTHTMRGGKSLQDRGVIPRLLSAIYRKGRKLEKDSEGDKRIEVAMSYYEIYNDKVFDLFEPPEKRTPTGLPIRDNNGKTVVAGLTERPCTSLKEFEQLYDHANVNRSTGATKLNAHSSRSHAILCVKVTQHHPDRTVASTVSAIDLAGSEDNRRTGNAKEALVESSSINKSLFVLAQCVEAISKKQSRIPYRESKMTRILSLGQNNGFTVMILNLAPVRSYHLDTLSSLNFANRTKKIELREVENEPIFRGISTSKPASSISSVSITGTAVKRQPLRPISAAINVGLKSTATTDKPIKAFSVFAERVAANKRTSAELTSSAMKRMSGASSQSAISRLSKVPRTDSITRPSISHRPVQHREPALSRAGIEEIVNRMVEEKLANHALSKPEVKEAALSEEMQRRLEALEQRVEAKSHGQDTDARAEGLQYLLMAKQHSARGEDASALRMYQLALPFFPENQKLRAKMDALRGAMVDKRCSSDSTEAKKKERRDVPIILPPRSNEKRRRVSDDDFADEQDDEDDYDDDFRYTAKKKSTSSSSRKRAGVDVFVDEQLESQPAAAGSLTPRTTSLLRIINSRDIAQIRQLKGVGAKKAEAIVSCLCGLDDDETGRIVGMDDLEGLKGVGRKGVEVMRMGLTV